MEKIRPMLFTTLKKYSGAQLMSDVIAGIIVAIIALPLSIALALASGVGPEQGIYTAIAAGFVISFLGGSQVQIAGPRQHLQRSWQVLWRRAAWKGWQLRRSWQVSFWLSWDSAILVH